MNKKIILIPIVLILTCFLSVGILFGGSLLWSKVGPKPAEKNEVIFKGINYIRDVRRTPRPMVVHIIMVDLREPGISTLVTPGNPDADLPLKARTTSKFLDVFEVQVAINGDAFTPWHSYGLIDYYPHSGDPVDPVGFAASKGVVYSHQTDAEPILYISRSNRAQFNSPPGKVYNAISGNQMLVSKGKMNPIQDEAPQPRTAVGLDKNAKHLIFVVIDGRQPGYSEGATLGELADILIEFGAYNGMNLDGGGSSTLVMEGGLTGAKILNSPIEHRIPNRQRPVGNHLGVFARSLGDG
jgi:hypothetical protein